MDSPVTFAELIERGTLEIGDGYRAKLDELGGNGPLFLRAVSVSDGSIRYEGERFRDELRPRLASKLGRAGDVVITTKGASTGRTAFVREDAPEFVYSPHLSFWRSRSPGDLDPGFLRYWAGSLLCSEQVAAMAASTDMSLYLSLVDQRRLKIHLPSPTEQRAIAGVLGALDDKIELNRRMSETLERLAITIFRREYWCSPDRDTWPEEQLGAHFEVVRGLSYTGAGLSDAGLPLHNLNSIKAGGGYSRAGLKRYVGQHKERHVARAGDVIVANTDLTWNFEVIASPAIVPSRFGETGLFSHHLYRVRPQEGSPLTPSLIYLQLLAGPLRSEVSGYANGTTVNMLPLDALQKPRFRVPPRKLAERLDAAVTPLFARAEAAETESETLAELRDTLLPKLISGELRVRDAEVAVEAAEQ